MICNNLLKVALFLLLRFAQPAHQICRAGSAALYDIVTKGSPAQPQHCLRPIMFLFVFRIWPASHHRRWCEPRQQITITALQQGQRLFLCLQHCSGDKDYLLLLQHCFKISLNFMAYVGGLVFYFSQRMTHQNKSTTLGYYHFK